MNLNAFYQDSPPDRDSFYSSISSSRNSNQPEEETIQMRFNKIIIQADQLMANQQYAEAVTKLNLLTEKINFLKLNQKPYDKKIQLVCLYNLAAAYHKQWILDECVPLVDKFVIMLKSTIQQQQSKGKSYYWYKMKHLLIKTQLQYCAILSQVGDHFKALKIAIEVSSSLKEFFQKGSNEVNKFLNRINKLQSKKSLSSSWGSDTGFNHHVISNDKVQFATSLLTQAKQNLNELLKIQTYDEIIKQNFDKVRQQLVGLKSRTYFWKDNPENNIKLLRKELSQQYPKDSTPINPGKEGNIEERSLLGIKKSNNWIEQITIAKIMVMSPINYLQFCEKDNIIFQFNYKNIIEKIILVSVTYFSLAIELRFIQTSEINEKKENQLQSQPHNKKKISAKEGQEKPQEMKKSQVFHLKSIVLLCKLIKENSAFLNHLVMNYHKHYKQDLITIEEESSMAQFSHIYDKKNKSISQNLKLAQNQFILPQDSDQQEQGLTLSPLYPRQSAYFQDHQIQKIKKKTPIQKKNSLALFKKPNKKDIDFSQERSKKYQNEISTSRNQNSSQKEIKSARYPKSFYKKLGSQDRTIKKISSGKIITITSPQKLKMLTQRSKDKSSQRQSSTTKFNSVRNIEKKQVSTRTVQSFSLGKTSMNSTTLIHKKRRGQKSPQKQKVNLQDLKESTQFQKADFKKKQKRGQKEKITAIPVKMKDKKKEKLQNGLKLLKQSNSNPNLGISYNTKGNHLDDEYESMRQKSRKFDKNIVKRWQ